MILLGRVCFIFLLAIFVSACVPRNMHVETGLDPRHVNTDVRFRTTYYFRTFDYCWDADGKTGLKNKKDLNVDYRTIIPATDTLYRYRVTGKASSLFTDIRFESGVLKAKEIDPFGTSIRFSKKTDNFTINPRDNLGQMEPAAEPEANASSSSEQDGSTPQSAQTKTAKTETENEDKEKAHSCKINETVRKGFQIMGPEGVKTYDQDDRLVIAMSNSADPLIETMKEYSGRILNAKEDVSAQLVALALEDSRISRLRVDLADARRTNVDENTIFDAAIRTLSAASGKKDQQENGDGQ